MQHALSHIRREIFGLTQADFAKALKVNQSTVSRWERGELRPSGDELVAIRNLARARGIDWNDSWFFEPPQGGAQPEAAA